MSKEGKVVASGDTMKPEQSGQDMLKKSSFKIEPGQYELVIIPPKDVPGETPYQLNFVQKVAKSPDEAVERPFDKIMREREARLKQWAAEGCDQVDRQGENHPLQDEPARLTPPPVAGA
ncbi:hypothetical protein [Azospirillum formosense]|uniref:hypothetical protein n=1 Tax=Azospirillum formosense TaxID=861533 RepID=UPI001C92812C|nr:hypothetical protein [Azospirillum formosense]MBY3751619.1 hypothetical protein [Azospirillum formosense]